MNDKNFVEQEMNLVAGIKEFLDLNGYDDYRVVLSALSIMLSELIGMTMTEKEIELFLDMFSKAVNGFHLEFGHLVEKEN